MCMGTHYYTTTILQLYGAKLGFNTLLTCTTSVGLPSLSLNRGTYSEHLMRIHLEQGTNTILDYR